MSTASSPVVRDAPSQRRDVQLGITAAICTRDRPEQLARAIASLMDQTPAPAEIIVVDNNSKTDATRRTVASFPRVRYVKESRAGLNFARNAALRSATQPIVAFLDDDAVADAQWSLALCERFKSDAELVACAGRVEALSTEHEGQRIVESNGGYARGRESITLPRDGDHKLHGLRAPLIAWTVSMGSGCSLAVRREVALAVGGFDTALGGRALPGGDDHDMLWRLLAAGCSIGYEPAAVAWHEHRHEPRAAYAQIVGHQRGLLAFLAKAVFYGSVRRRAGALLFLIWRLLKPGVRLARRALGRDPLPVTVLLRMWWNCWWGMLSYPFVRVSHNRLK